MTINGYTRHHQSIQFNQSSRAINIQQHQLIESKKHIRGNRGIQQNMFLLEIPGFGTTLEMLLQGVPAFRGRRGDGGFVDHVGLI